MAFPRFPYSLYLLSFSLLVQLAASYPMGYRCSGKNIVVSPNSPFYKNLNKLLSYLDSKTPLTGFSFGSWGHNQSQVYGLAICQGGLNTTTNCKTCVDGAIKEIQTVCQSTEAIIFYDDCQLKYSDLDFFGEVDQDHWFYVLEPSTNVSNPVYFNEKVVELLNNLTEKAHKRPKMYAAGALAIGNSTKIYGLVQCTLDLSNSNCKSCLTEAINFIPQYLYGKTGGEQLGGSCTVRFEVYPFVKGA